MHLTRSPRRFSNGKNEAGSILNLSPQNHSKKLEVKSNSRETLKVTSTMYVAYSTAFFLLLSVTAVGGKMLRNVEDSRKNLFQHRSLQECGDGSDTLEMEDIQFFFELNDSDDDLGVQLTLGTPEPWTNMSIYDPSGILLATFQTKANFQLHGLSDFFFESAEPNFEEITRDEIQDRFPAGTYVFLGTAIEGECLYGTAALTHDIPGGPTILEPTHNDTIPHDDLIISWAPNMDDNATIDSFEVIVTNEKESDYKLDARFSSETRSALIPKSFLTPDTLYEIEVLTREVSGNQAISIVFVTTKVDGKEYNEDVAVMAGEQDDEDKDEVDEDEDKEEDESDED
jgi:hypothetical protein